MWHVVVITICGCNYDMFYSMYLLCAKVNYYNILLKKLAYTLAHTLTYIQTWIQIWIQIWRHRMR